MKFYSAAYLKSDSLGQKSSFPPLHFYPLQKCVKRRRKPINENSGSGVHYCLWIFFPQVKFSEKKYRTQQLRGYCCLICFFKLNIYTSMSSYNSYEKIGNLNGLQNILVRFYSFIENIWRRYFQLNCLYLTQYSPSSIHESDNEALDVLVFDDASQC